MKSAIDNGEKSSAELRGDFSLSLLAIFLAFGLLWRPLLLSTPFSGIGRAWELVLVDDHVLGALALCLLLAAVLKKGILSSKWDIRIALGALAFICVSLFQFMEHENYSFREFCVSTIWVSIPWVAYLYRHILKKMIGPYFLLFWLFNTVYAVPEWLIGTGPVGITGNRNWHGSLLVATAPFATYYLYRALIWRWGSQTAVKILSAIPAIISLPIIFKCESRGANVGLLVGAYACGVATLVSHENKRYRRKAVKFVISTVIAIVLAGVVFIILYGDKLASAISEDVRPPLWNGAAEMAINNPVMGVGQPSYESHYAKYIPWARFLRSRYYTTRSDHPHNHLLYLAGSFGILGLLPLALFYLLPFGCLRKFNSLTPVSKMLFFAYVALLTHSMFDLVASRWPTNILLLLSQGMLIGDAVSEPNEKDIKRHRLMPFGGMAVVASLVAALMLALAVGMAIKNARSSYERRLAGFAYDHRNLPLALHFYDKSASIQPAPKVLYNAGILSLLHFNDPYLGWKYFSALEARPDRILAHANSHMADCCLRFGWKREALRYLELELVAQPTSLVALYNKLALERSLRMDAAASDTAQRIMGVLKFKGLKLEDLRMILANPRCDGKFYMLKEWNH